MFSNLFCLFLKCVNKMMFSVIEFHLFLFLSFSLIPLSSSSVPTAPDGVPRQDTPPKQLRQRQIRIKIAARPSHAVAEAITPQLLLGLLETAQTPPPPPAETQSPTPGDGRIRQGWVERVEIGRQARPFVPVVRDRDPTVLIQRILSVAVVPSDLFLLQLIRSWLAFHLHQHCPGSVEQKLHGFRVAGPEVVTPLGIDCHQTQEYAVRRQARLRVGKKGVSQDAVPMFL